MINFNTERKDITIYYKKKLKNGEENKSSEKWTMLILILTVFILSGIIILLVIKANKLKYIIKNRSRLNVLEVELAENKDNNNI